MRLGMCCFLWGEIYTTGIFLLHAIQIQNVFIYVFRAVLKKLKGHVTSPAAELINNCYYVDNFQGVHTPRTAPITQMFEVYNWLSKFRR